MTNDESISFILSPFVFRFFNRLLWFFFMPFRSLLYSWPVLLALVLFLWFATPDLDLPGLHYDEALEAATPAALLLNGQAVTVINDGALRLGTLALPLMVQNHIGAIQIYAAMPFVALFGPTTAALRAMTVTVGALTLIGVYLFTLQLAGRAAAGAAVLWLAAFPSFVFWSRQGAFVTNLAPGLAVWAFVFGARFRNQGSGLRQGALERRGEGSAFLTGLFAGLAVWAKLSALWLLVGSVAWAGIIWLANRRNSTVEPRKHLLPWRAIASGVVGFLLGILPIILYNFLAGFPTLAVVGGSASTTYLGTSNLNVADNLRTRVGQFADVLRSGEHLWYLGGSFPDTLALTSVLVAFATVLVWCVRAGSVYHEETKNTPDSLFSWQRTLFVPFLILACVLQSCFTISALWFTHFAIAVWLPAVVVGSGFAALQRSRRPVAWLGALALIGVIISHARTSGMYLDAVRTTGGLSFHSSAITDVSRFLAARPEPLVALDWGIAAQVEYLTNGQKRVEEYYGFAQEPPADYAAQLGVRFERGELYLMHAEFQEAFPRRQAFLEAVAAAGLRAETVNVSIRRDGWPMIEVWRVVK